MSDLLQVDLVRLDRTVPVRAALQAEIDINSTCCGANPRNWYTMVSVPEHGGADMIDAPEDS